VFTDEKQFPIIRPRNSQNDRQILPRNKVGYSVRPHVMKVKSVMVSSSRFDWLPKSVL